MYSNLFNNYCYMETYVAIIDNNIKKIYNENNTLVIYIMFIVLYFLLFIELYIVFNLIINSLVKLNEKIKNSIDLIMEQNKNIDVKNIENDKKLYDIVIKINNTEKCFVNIEKKLKILNDEMV